MFQPALEKLKQTFFPHSPDEPVIFHRSEIINKKGKFWRLRDFEIERRFNEELLSFLKSMNYVLITVVIDKKSHVERYKESAFHPYHYCLATLLERYCGLLHFYKAKGDVLAESRGGKEDMQLKHAYNNIYENGTLFRKGQFFQDVLTSKEIKLKPKTANIAGTQVADLLAHPSKQEILFEKGILPKYQEKFGVQMREVIKVKYNRHCTNGKVEGYGKIYLA